MKAVRIVRMRAYGRGSASPSFAAEDRRERRQETWQCEPLRRAGHSRLRAVSVPLRRIQWRESDEPDWPETQTPFHPPCALQPARLLEGTRQACAGFA